MNRKLIYIFSLVGFFLMWGMFGFVAAAPRSEPVLQATLPRVESTSVVPGATDSAMIPVTGEPEPVLMEILLFYGLIGLSALFLILGLLSFANKSTAPNVQEKGPSSDEIHKN
jgi:hypothetical protein